MGDSGIISSITEGAASAVKGVAKGTVQEISQTVSQGFGQISGDQKSPEELAQEIQRLREEDQQQSSAKITNIEAQIQMARADREQRHKPLQELNENSRPAEIVNLGKLVEQRRERKENKIAAA